MIVARIKRIALKDYNLGSRLVPKEISLKLIEYDKQLELIWDADAQQWELYRIEKFGVASSDDDLIWQISCPNADLTTGIVDWIKTKDTTEGKTLDAEQRQKRWKILFTETLRKQRIKEQKQLQNVYYELGHRCRWLDRYRQNQRQCVVPAGPVVGINKGKAIRAYKKRETI